MPRNLDRRVEILFPVQDPRHVRQLRDEALATYLSDNAMARLMQPDGAYQRLRPASGEEALQSQAWFIRQRALSQGVTYRY
jgi:polyphosphate kinase